MMFRNAALVAVMAGAAVTLAGPASADPLSGSYTQTTTESNKFPPGSHLERVFTPCGPDCTRDLTSSNGPADFHLQGSTWSYQDEYSSESFDANSLAGRFVSNSGWYVNFQLTRND